MCEKPNIHKLAITDTNQMTTRRRQWFNSSHLKLNWLDDEITVNGNTMTPDERTTFSETMTTSDETMMTHDKTRMTQWRDDRSIKWDHYDVLPITQLTGEVDI